MTQEQRHRSEAARLFLTDEAGNYYVMTPNMREPARVPESHKREVDEVIGEPGEVTGYLSFAATPQLSFGGAVQYRVLGACNGACARTFGVLQQRAF
jgi:hypothetical protein